MATLGNCYVGKTKLTLKSKRAINEIRSVMESGNWFSSALAAVPVYQIFFSPGLRKVLLKLESILESTIGNNMPAVWALLLKLSEIELERPQSP